MAEKKATLMEMGQSGAGPTQAGNGPIRSRPHAVTDDLALLTDSGKYLPGGEKESKERDS
jgi:hypothetical protein